MQRRISIVTVDPESARDCPRPIHVARPRPVAFRRDSILGRGQVIAGVSVGLDIIGAGLEIAEVSVRLAPYC